MRICLFLVKSCMHSCVPWQLCQVLAAFQQSCLVKQWKESINKEAQEMLTMPDGYIDDVCSVEFPHNYSTKWDCGVALDSLDSILSSLWDLSHFSPSCCWPISIKKLILLQCMLQIDFFCCRPSREIESRKLNLGKKWEIQGFSKLSEFSTICKIYWFFANHDNNNIALQTRRKNFSFRSFCYASYNIFWFDLQSKWTTKKNRRFCHAEHILDR